MSRVPGARYFARTHVALALLIAMVVIAGLLVPAPPAQAARVAPAVSNLASGDIVKAADLSKFQAGNIISDAVFFNSATMTEGQIQSFLDSKVKNCDPQYTCLKNKRDTSRTTTADAMCRAYSGASNESAARIILKVAQACGINPQVLLVMLEKEQGLVTHTWPSDWRYTIAMGQGCPDTAACDTRYYGFFNQVFGAARQLKIYTVYPNSFNYQAGQTETIQWHPNASCGTSRVYIENQATANLYIYTPYRPNAAALRAGYGEGDGCSSYGNRNFYQFFTDWFGSTQGDVCAAPSDAVITAASGLYVVNVAEVNARIAPTTACAAGAGVLRKDTLVLRTGEYGEWMRVDASGLVRWIHRDYLTALADTPAPTLSLDDQRHVFALDSTGSVWAYPFSSFGRWGTAVQLAGGTTLRQIVEIGDFDRDGHRDLIGIDIDGRVWLYRGDGTSFAQPQRVDVDWATMRLVSAIGDFSGDGVADVVTVSASGAMLLWRGDGQGRFTGSVQIGSGWSGMDLIVGGSDIDGDGSVDLVARNTAGRLYLYAGNGRGGWKSSGQIGKGWGAMTALALPADFTGDGQPDLLARDNAGRLLLYRGTGSGLAYLTQVGQRWNGMTSFAGPGARVGVAARAQRAGVGDINGDGAPDILAVTTAGLRLYGGNGRGGFSSSVIVDASWSPEARAVALGDFDSDGRPDIGRIEAGSFDLLSGGVGATLAPAARIGRGWGGMRQIVGGVDVDSDGALDVLAVGADGNLRLYRGDGAGGWAEGAGGIVRNDWVRYDLTLNAGDFDGDGESDLITRESSTGALLLHSGDGNGGWKAARQIGRGWSSLTSVAAPGDFDGDGKTDVVARSSNGSLLLYRGDGEGGWLGSSTIGRGWSAILQIL